jgi:hypothetical protein
MDTRLAELNRTDLQRIQSADLMRVLSAKHFGGTRPVDYFVERWPHSVHRDVVTRHFETLHTKSTVAPGLATDGTWAGPLMVPSLLSGFLPLVKAASVLAKLPLTPCPFNVRIAKQIAGGSTSWQGEVAQKPITKLGFGNVSILWAKCLSMIVVSEELMRLAAPGSVEQLQQTITNEITIFVDTAFLSAAAAVPGVSPAGILNGITPITATADLAKDLGTLVATFHANRPWPFAPVLILSPAVASKVKALGAIGTDLTPEGGSLLNVPVVLSPAAGANAIVCDAAAIYLADAGLDLGISREALIEMVDTSAAPSASTVYQSTFQQNSVALRVERFVYWLVVGPNAVQYVVVP